MIQSGLPLLSSALSASQRLRVRLLAHERSVTARIESASIRR